MAEADHSPEGLQTAWLAYARELVKSPRMLSFFDTTKPNWDAQQRVEIPVNNRLQQESLEAQLDQLQAYLRQRLRVADLQVVFRLIEATAQPKAYTPEDKFRLLAEKNPKLMLLKNRFNLDF